VERKIETLVAAPAAVEDALASLIVDHPNPLLQTRALGTYIKRTYYPQLLSEPQARAAAAAAAAAAARGWRGVVGERRARCARTMRKRTLTHRPPRLSAAAGHLARVAADGGVDV